MSIAHNLASCMGGVRTTGDLVAWMQITRKMKLDAAKAHVAEKLGISVRDLTNTDVTRDRREALGIGITTAVAGSPKGIAAKYRIAELLDIDINSVNYFKSQIESLRKG
jgi:hypothetical protein